ncbi:hypothetical protein HMPREF0277_1038 [Corynebacterium accolens ATCC 49726]|nr:hypothetical protein HMPREF0277_1038 [Corynebacterium accolens ATCC 49726]
MLRFHLPVSATGVGPPLAVTGKGKWASESVGVSTMGGLGPHSPFALTRGRSSAQKEAAVSAEGVIHRAATKMDRVTVKWASYPQAGEISMDGEAAASLG